MKLDTKEYFDSNDKVEITEKGWVDLQKFVKSILWNNYARLGDDFIEDSVSECIIACVDKLDKFDKKKNKQLGGYLYWAVRGCITMKLYYGSKELSSGLIIEEKLYKQ